MPPKKTQKNKKIGKQKKTKKQDNKNKETVKERKKKSDKLKIQKKAEYMEFLIFMSIPEAVREKETGISNLTQFAKKYKLHQDTLTDWQKRDDFWDKVWNLKKRFFMKKTGNSLMKLYQRTITEGKAPEVKLLLNYTGELIDRQTQEHTVPPEIQAALDRMNKALDK